ncbi:MAG TPA: YheU family protein [Steroidobacteraceae bacterium]|nr:YheU family protein [Steroidobacteraceae bacterium]
MNDDKSTGLSEPVAIPHAELSAAALRGVIESFVLREGTDYGERDVSFETKVAQVRRQLDSGEAQIVFDPDSESIDIVVRRGGASSRVP